MRWLPRLCRRRRGKHAASLLARLHRRVCATPPESPISAAETTQARRTGEDALADALALNPEVREVSHRLRVQRTENHFSQMIAQALRESR